MNAPDPTDPIDVGVTHQIFDSTLLAEAVPAVRCKSK
jgi:hypothetical protein